MFVFFLGFICAFGMIFIIGGIACIISEIKNKKEHKRVEREKQQVIIEYLKQVEKKLNIADNLNFDDYPKEIGFADSAQQQYLFELEQNIKNLVK